MGHTARLDDGRIRAPKCLLSRLEQSEVARVGRRMATERGLSFHTGSMPPVSADLRKGWHDHRHRKQYMAASRSNNVYGLNITSGDSTGPEQ